MTIAAGAAALLLASAAPVGAQMVQGAGAAAAAASRAADELSRHLRTLTQRPQDFAALIGAADAALELGDANAALGFYARAEAIQPKSARVKAGLGRALLRLERPKEALKLFDDATDLDLDPAEIAGDRGLAYDLRGDYRRAQKDYQLALARRQDDEVTRRYALSLGISGDREKALSLLTPLLYKRDQQAWQARAFVLALTGDQAGANTIVRSVMPEPQAALMRGFLARLPQLKAGQKAMAVHLGRFPSDGRRYAAIDEGEGMRRSDASLPPRAVAASADTKAPRRRPGEADAPAKQPSPERLASIIPALREQAGVGGGEVKAASAEARPNQLAAIIAGIEAPEAKAQPVAAKTAKAPLAKAEPKKAKPKKAEPADPPRHWVQVAGGANKAALPKEWKRVTAKAPAEFKGRSPWTIAVNATNRLLTGPFETAADARRFVNSLAKAGVDAFMWSSAAGQEVAKLQLK